MNIPITLIGQNRQKIVAALIDCGASTMFLHKDFVQKNKVKTRKLERPIPLRNVDGTYNKAGRITDLAPLRMKIKDHEEEVNFAVTDTGDDDVILGIDWLREHNPNIDWQQGTMEFSRCGNKCQNKWKKWQGRRKMRREQEHQSKVDWHGIFKTLQDAHPEESGMENDEDLIIKDQGWIIKAGSTLSTRLTADAQPKEKKSFEELVPPQYRGFKKIFSQKESERFPTPKPWDHEIEIDPEKKLPRPSKPYPLSPKETKELDAFIDENLAKGYIIPSKSPMAAPVFFVTKKDGKLRLCQNYKNLNEITIKNRYPLPLISELVDRVQGARIFSKMDVRWGYNNVQIKKEDRWKAAFVTHRGLFEPTVMFFGMTNSPATFQTMMNHIFRDLLHCVAVYMDDIVVFTKTKGEHEKIVQEVLRRLEEHDLFLKPEKCEFEKLRIDFLGMVISEKGVEMDQTKVKAVLDWIPPKKVKELQGFLGFSNFYRRFIGQFSHLAKPLTRLLRKDTSWSWGPEQQQAFDKLKEAFTTAPILSLPDPTKEYLLEADGSDFATGAILSQMQDDGKIHPIAFYSKSFNEAERNYEIYDKELLAIIRGLQEWRHHLEGSDFPIRILSDHKNLEFFKKAQNLTRRQARWALFLSRFQFEIVYRPGIKGGKPDALSRKPEHKPEGPDNQGRVLLDPQVFSSKATRKGHTAIEGDKDMLRRIRTCQEKDKEVLEALQTLQVKGPTKLKNGLEEWNTEDGLILFRGKVYVPKDNDIRRDLIKVHHDSLAVGHPGRWKTYELASRNYWWPGMSKFVHDYVDGCDRCNRTKIFPEKPRGPLHPNPVPTRPWQIISVDLVTDLPDTDGYDSIMNVICRLTKITKVIKTKKSVDTDGVVELYMENIWKLYGVPDVIISDRGPQFASALMKGILNKLGCTAALSTAFHPQTDGQTERHNQEVEQFLRTFCDYRQEDWAKLLPYAEFALNNRHHSAINCSPFKALYGYDPVWTVAPNLEVVPEATQRIKALKAIQEEAQASLVIAAERMKVYYDRSVAKAPEYQKGDKVWLEATNIKTTQPARKLADKRLGPFEVDEQIGPLNYRLILPQSFTLHPVFHTSLLSPYHKDKIVGRVPEPPPAVEIAGHDEYEVERILDSRKRGRGLQYLIKWKGYAGEDSWVARSQLPNAQDVIDEFHTKFPQAAKISSTRRETPKSSRTMNPRGGVMSRIDCLVTSIQSVIQEIRNIKGRRMVTSAI